ncbi:DUF1127 domain-containing protein [Rhizobium sp. LC145]|uniref:DUF1127 domain-containing protein n=1 Tax=Rhizobium sp. LC145 TaxID=1120688 RepID=UPI00062A2661|nr:DUF1127 domain-containing protein [Rhizobium sp. LC145]KKX34023.1 hypothetical protein YH62_02295 [Rhizobium sp. LC145]TKT67009.1 DUF1127 domain-containing protein [Rhizobiaceae bacterium LC148]
MRESQVVVADTLAATVDELYRKFGAWRTVWALILAVRRRRQAENQVAHLSNWMRRDIGLPESEDAPGEGYGSLPFGVVLVSWARRELS